MSLCINEILFLLYIFIKYVLVATDHDLDFQQQIDVEVTDSPRLSSLLTQSTEELLLWEHELNFQKQIEVEVTDSPPLSPLPSQLTEKLLWWDVESLLRMFTRRLDIDTGTKPDPHNISELPEGYDKQNLFTVCLKGDNGSVEEIQVYDPNCLLMNGDKFLPGLFPGPDQQGKETINFGGIKAEKATGGTRKVAFYSIYGKHHLCFKQWPEAPWIERSVYLLYDELFPKSVVPLPKSEVILMNSQVFLVSEYIAGEPLEAFLENAQKDPGNCVLNEKSFQELAIFCLLTNPEDCHLRNCLVRKLRVNDSKEYQIVLIDNDRSFGKAITGEILQEGKMIATRVHCVLFCFHAMLKKKLEQDILARIRGSTTIGIRLAERLSKESKFQRNLRSYIDSKYIFKETVGIDSRETILGNTLGSGVIDKLFYRWPKIVKSIQLEESAADLLIRQYPQLANLYGLETITNQQTETINADIIAVLNRIRSIDAGRHAPMAPPSSYFPLLTYFKASAVNDSPFVLTSSSYPSLRSKIIDPEDWEDVFARMQEIFAKWMDEMSENDRIYILGIFKNINRENRTFIKELIMKEMDRYERVNMMEAIKNISLRDLEGIKEIFAAMGEKKCYKEIYQQGERSQIINAIKNVKSEDRADVIKNTKELVKKLISKKRDGHNCVLIIKAVMDIAPSYRKDVIARSRKIFTKSMDGDDYASIIKAVMDIAPLYREDVIAKAQEKITEEMSGEKRARIIDIEWRDWEMHPSC